MLRQHPIGPFIVDFFVPSARLIIEVDGRSHEGRGHYDRDREVYLKQMGLRFVRLTNDEILSDVDASVAQIAAALPAETLHTPTPLRGEPPPGGGF